MAWYDRFELTCNPFDTDPFSFSVVKINHNDIIDEFEYLVESGSIFVLQAGHGAGKTTYLRHIIERFKKGTRIAYINGKQISKAVDIEQILNKLSKSVFPSLFSKKPQGVVVLFDDVDEVDEKNCEKIKYYFDQNYIKSVVFTTTDYAKLSISASLKDRIMDQVFQLPPITKFDALRIVRSRFSDHFFLSDDVILQIFAQSQMNIKQTLQNCESICEFVVREGRGEVLPKYLTYVFRRMKGENANL